MRTAAAPATGSWRSNLASLFLGIICALIMAEIGVRVLWPRLSAKPTLNDRPPFYYAYETSDAVDDQPYQVPKPANVFRITAIGDSFTFAPYLQFDDAFPERLERMLNLNDPRKTQLRAEVVNFGRWGASTRSEVAKTVRAVEEGTDLVLLEITLNDPQLTDYEPKNPRLRGKYIFGELKITPQHTPLLYHWRTLGLIASRIHNSQTKESYIRYHRSLFYEKETWDTFTEALVQIQGVCAAAGVPLAVFIFPFVHYSFDAQYPFHDVHKKLSDFLAAQGIQHFDLLEAFQHAAPERLVVIPGKDLHPNEVAHRIAAEQIYLWLETRQLIPQPLRIKNKYKNRARRVKAGDPRPNSTHISAPITAPTP